jgi:hypothetical protein
MKETNCIGFAYYALGLKSEDTFEYQPALQEILKYFDITEKGDEDAIGVLDIPSKSSGFPPEILHLAVIDPNDKNFVYQRFKKNDPVSREPLQKAIYEDYKKSAFFPKLKAIRLKLKDQYKSANLPKLESLLT